MIRDSRIANDLTAAWPSLPYIGLGVWLAWAYLAYSGSMWLSDVETNGENLAGFYIVSTVSFALVMLVAPLKEAVVERMLGSDACMLGAGIAASLGCIMVVLAGPYYLAASALFYPGVCLTGASTALVGLQCARLYAGLAPRKAILYAAFSHIVLACLYFIATGSPQWQPIEGGPSLVGIIALVGLPVAASALVCLPARSDARTARATACKKAVPPVFWKMVLAVFVFALVENSVRANVVYEMSLDVTQDSNSVIMLVRIAMAAAFAFLATVDRNIDFGRIYSFVMVAAVAFVAFVPVFGPLNVGWSMSVTAVSVVFEFVIWCILAFVVFQKRVSFVLVFGFGYGSFMLGSALGWLESIYVIPLIANPSWQLATYLVLALAVLACVFVLFSERDFDKLFMPESDEESLSSLFGINPFHAADAKKGSFGATVDLACEQFGLSPRERDVLRYLAMGYSADAVAERLGVSWNTARTHSRNIYAKMGVHSRQELIEAMDAMKCRANRGLATGKDR